MFFSLVEIDWFDRWYFEIEIENLISYFMMGETLNGLSFWNKYRSLGNFMDTRTNQIIFPSAARHHHNQTKSREECFKPKFLGKSPKK